MVNISTGLVGFGKKDWLDLSFCVIYVKSSGYVDFVIFEFIMTGSLWGRRKDVGRVNLEDAIAGVESSQVGKEDWAGTQDVLPVPCWEGRKSCDMVGRQGEYWHKPRLLLV